MRRIFGYMSYMKIYVVGLVIGIVGACLVGDFLLQHSQLLGAELLQNMKEMSVDRRALLYIILRERVGRFILLTLLATTYLGIVACGTAAFAYGFMGGVFFSAAIIQYGLKGVILILCSIFPHILLYGPAFFLLLVWCEKLCRGIYYQKNIPERLGEFRSQYLPKLLLIILLMALGCILESYINPPILFGLLKIF